MTTVFLLIITEKELLPVSARSQKKEIITTLTLGLRQTDKKLKQNLKCK